MDVLIVDDHALVREGLRMLLVGTGLFERCVECASLSAALAEIEASDGSLGLVVLDSGLPDAQGLLALERILGARPEMSVLVVSGDDDASTINSAFARGARGYVPKNSSALALRAAVETVLRGELYVPPHVLPSHGAPRPAAPPPRGGDGAAAGLTPRQSEVLALVAQGLSNKEVGDRLDMSPSTVRAHVSAIFKTLGVENRTQAATSEVATALLGARTDRAR